MLRKRIRLNAILLLAFISIAFSVGETSGQTQSDRRYEVPAGTSGPCTAVLTQGFDDISTLPAAGWIQDNNSIPGKTNWFQGDTSKFPSQTGAPPSYIAADFNNTSGWNTISNWLLTPTLTLQDGRVLTFYTRTVDPVKFPDRMQVRMSTAGTSSNVGTEPTDVGDFTTLLLDINQFHSFDEYPTEWTQFFITVTGVPTPTTGRFAFRYFIPDGGPEGPNSDFIGIDTVAFSEGACPTPSSPTPTATSTTTPTNTPTATPTPFQGARPAAGIQQMPQISKGDTTSLAVWADKRTTIGRYVPDDLAGIGSEFDIYAARLNTDGTVIDTTPIVVNQARHDQTAPSVAWNGTGWIVVWITERLSNPYHGDVVAVRVSADGVVLDGTPIVVGVSTDASNPPNFTAATSDGTNWVVAWGQGAYTTPIRGARISPDGTLIDTGGSGKILVPDPNFTAPSSPRFAFANGQFLMIWTVVASGGYAISAQRFDTNLDPIGAKFRANQFAGSNSSRADVATDGTNFLIAWREERYTYHEVFATRISAAGAVLDPAGIKIFGSLTEDMPYDGNVATAWDGTRYAVGFPGTVVNSLPSGVLTSYVTTGGAVTGPTLVAETPEARSLNAEPRSGGGVQFLWYDTRLSVDGDVFGASLTAAGTPGTNVAVSLGAARETQPRFTTTQTGEFAYSYRSVVSGEASVYLQRLDADGNSLGDATLVTTGTESLINPSVAFNGTVYLVVWEINTQIYGRLVASEGTPVGEAFPVMPGNQPDVAALGSQFLVVDNYEPTNHIRFTQGVRVESNGTVLGPPVRIGTNYDLRPRVKAFGSRWAVVWEKNVTHDNPQSSITGALINADGTVFRSFGISSSSSDAPDIAIGAANALVVWEKSSNIYGRRIDADGNVLDASDVLIADGPKPLYAPAASWDGNRFIVLYSDTRDSDLEPPADIWGALVGPDGVVITPGGFPVANSPLPEEMSAVASNSLGTTIFGYAQFMDRLFAAYRIDLRRFPFDRNYFVTSEPASRTIPVGGSADFTINVNAVGGFTGDVQLSIQGLPGGATSVFTPPVISGSGSSTLQITTSATTAQGIYSLSVIGTNGAQSSEASISLIIDNDPPSTGFSVADLGTLGGTESQANAINESGQVVGYAFNAAQKRRAFLYSNGPMQDLGTFGGLDSEANDINDSGLVVGQAKNAANKNRAFVYNGTLQDLGTIGGDAAGATGINNSGQITGWANEPSQNYHAFLHSGGTMQDLGVIQGYWSYGGGINSSGHIAGTGYTDGPVAGSKAFLYRDGVKTVLGTLGVGRDSNGARINDSDQVVGNSTYLDTFNSPHAFLVPNGVMQDLGTFGGPDSKSFGINNVGIVVGTAELASGAPQAFLYDGTLRNLNALIPAGSGWTLTEARDINEQGQIVGKGTINGQTHAFVLTPLSSSNVPPGVQITSPQNNSTYGQPSVTINAAASDPDGTVVRAEFYADGVLIGTQQSVPYAILWNGMAPNHTYVLTARAFDDRGGSTVSAPVSVTIGSASPSGVITGVVRYGNAPAGPSPVPVSNVQIGSIAGNPPVSALTAAGGGYNLTGFGSGSYTVAPSKTGAVNGSITSFDAARIAQHSVGINPLSGNQLVVGDVSGNGTLSSFDAGQIARYTVGITGSGSTATWRFTPANRAYSSVTTNISGEDYSALLMGEVSGNWTNTTPRPAAKVHSGPSTADSENGDAAASPISVTAQPVVTAADKELIIPVSVKGAAGQGIISYEFDLRYDPSVLRPQRDAADLTRSVSRGLTVVFNIAEPGLLRVAVYGAVPINEDGLLIDLGFTAVGTPGAVSPLTWERLMFNEGLPMEATDGRIELF